jgi:hypothetical protein
VPEADSSDLLLDLYKIAVEEYRFEVRLNWDRTAYYLTLNSGLIAVAAGLLKVGSAPIVNLVVASMFLIGFLSSLIGIRNIRRGHEYYRRTVIKKTLLEEQLGLNKPLEGHAPRLTLAVGTTVGQAEPLQILHDTDKWLKRSPRLSSVTAGIIGILTLFCIANALGIALSVWLFRHPPLNPSPVRGPEFVPVAVRWPLANTSQLLSTATSEFQNALVIASIQRLDPISHAPFAREEGREPEIAPCRTARSLPGPSAAENQNRAHFA